MGENITQLIKAEQDHIVTQLAPTIQCICKHYTNGFYYPNGGCSLFNSIGIGLSKYINGIDLNHLSKVKKQLF